MSGTVIKERSSRSAIQFNSGLSRLSMSVLQSCSERPACLWFVSLRLACVDIAASCYPNYVRRQPQHAGKWIAGTHVRGAVSHPVVARWNPPTWHLSHQKTSAATQSVVEFERRY